VKRLLGIAVLVACALPAAGASASSPGRSCGFIHASVPYSAHGSASRWRVYVQGQTTCSAGESVLRGVMHLQGHLHRGASEASTYILYQGWLCPAGDMGAQICNHPAHRPFSAHALALECGIEENCPSHAPNPFLALAADLRAPQLLRF
jgi:hypothetical protein